MSDARTVAVRHPGQPWTVYAFSDDAQRPADGSETPQEDVPLPERVAAAQEAIYGPRRGSTEASQRAADLRPVLEEAGRRMKGQTPDDPRSDDVRQRAARIAQEMRGRA